MQENLCIWSGNERIDNLIEEKQQKANDPEDFWEWIPYNKFENIEKIGKGGFATIYSAIWKDGYLDFYNEKNYEFRRYKELKVALKCLDNCKNLGGDFLNEV